MDTSDDKFPKLLSSYLILIKSMKCFVSGVIIKSLLTLIGSKFNIGIVLAQPWGLCRFGLFCGLFSFIFKVARRILAPHKFSKDIELFLAAALSSVSIYVLPPKDMTLLKVLLYPRAIEGLYSLLKEKGLVKPLPYGGETLLAYTTNCVIVYNYTYENFNLPGNMIKSLNQYCDLTKGEQ